MQLIRQTSEISRLPRGCALSIGNFDGVHQGHARIAGRLRSWSSQAGGPAVVLTFEPHPVRLLRPEQAPPPLTWTERKAELLGALGVDYLIAWPTTRPLLQMSCNEFFDEIIVSHIGASVVVEGPNFFFGKNREGDVEKLARFCQSSGMAFEVVEPALDGGLPVSSTRIREAVKQGDVDTACRLLTQPYRIRGLVVHGDGRGAGLGFPTANLSGIDTLIPASGIYAGIARRPARDSADPRIAAIHVGPVPTFGVEQLQVEVHVVDFCESLYGEILEVDFLSKLRNVEKFDSVEVLKQQMQLDVAEARAVGSRWLESRSV